ncbi:MAG: hypothetical protein WD491_04170 [Balneolales bacterium]
MDIKTSKIELAKLILEIDNPTLIQKIHELVTHQIDDFWQTLSEQEKEEIHLGLSQLDRGERISFEEYMKNVS